MNRYDKRMRELRAEMVRGRQGVQPITLSEADLQRVEREIGHPLPPDYREFLRDYGCYNLFVAFWCREMYGTGDWGGISLFFGLIPENSSPWPYEVTYDLLWTYNVLKRYAPFGLLPIGSDDGGNPTCLAISGGHIGAVYYWDRTVSWDASDGSGIYFIADSFDEFMQMLKTQEELDAESRGT